MDARPYVVEAVARYLGRQCRATLVEDGVRKVKVDLQPSTMRSVQVRNASVHDVAQRVANDRVVPCRNAPLAEHG